VYAESYNVENCEQEIKQVSKEYAIMIDRIQDSTGIKQKSMCVVAHGVVQSGLCPLQSEGTNFEYFSGIMLHMFSHDNYSEAQCATVLGLATKMSYE